MKQADIEQRLQEIFQRTAPPGPDDARQRRALAGVMAQLHAPTEDLLGTLDSLFDPYRAPVRVVPYLASWFDIETLWRDADAPSQVDSRALNPGVGRLRMLVAAAAMLSRWRGTARGLRLFLEMATGVTGFEVEEAVAGENGEPIPFHIRVRVPPAATEQRTLIERVIALEKPAHVTCELALL